MPVHYEDHWVLRAQVGEAGLDAAAHIAYADVARNATLLIAPKPA